MSGTSSSENVIVPPAGFWRGTAVRERASATAEVDPLWDELVRWFEHEREWAELVATIEGAER